MARRVRQQPTIGGPPFQSSLSHNIDASGAMMRRRAFRFNQQGTDLERASKHLMTLHRSSFHHLMKRRA
ncbi:hypothetical protein MPC1_1450005 [Methylocella tundrae]|nr:hypothetical protein MPC1_1450005 [Methylocella tundrae]